MDETLLWQREDFAIEIEDTPGQWRRLGRYSTPGACVAQFDEWKARFRRAGLAVPDVRSRILRIKTIVEIISDVPGSMNVSEDVAS